MFLVLNNGHSVAINLPPSMSISKGLEDRYTAVQMHFHWGGLDLESSGSEHTIDGIRYVAELHIVHYNSDKYSSFSEASTKPDGLAVLAFFYEDGHLENTYYSDFISSLSKIRYAGQFTEMQPFDISTMLPDNLSNFYRYKGSLTTPPCFESIIWTIFDTPIVLSSNQIRLLENSVMDWENKTLRNDYRHAQPINDRVVEASFQPLQQKGQSPVSYVEIQTHRSMNLTSFTMCLWIRASDSLPRILLSYATRESDNELVLSVGLDWGLWIGGQFVNVPLNFQTNEWVHYCATWTSETGAVEMWNNGLVARARHVKKGYIIEAGGSLIMGKDQDGIEGMYSDAFVGDVTTLNMWDHVLSPSEIRRLMECRYRWRKGNVVGWGVSSVALFGGVTLAEDTICFG
ncbi:carbonic anhydrase 6 [Hypanus sabinus]|uniref:carbonic anhydrase 6 n=1 Tax=Hypanus sabinus TaxID=79690 RepID=UPI0028C3FBB9|nr:carbonic anhydrase 6 [Hypanus sabinus]